jgi:large subunit ribosomal protein L22
MYMEATAKARYLRLSGRKARLVADLVRGMKVDKAIATLKYVPQHAGEPIQKLVKSAAANAISVVGTGRLKAEDLTISTIFVDNGPSLKRFRAASMGRANPIKHHLCHITVVVSGQAREERQRRRAKAAAAKETKETKETKTEE